MGSPVRRLSGHSFDSLLLAETRRIASDGVEIGRQVNGPVKERVREATPTDDDTRRRNRDRAGLTVTVLGATSPYPGPGTACPGYLVEGFGSRVLLDCGSGVLSRLVRYCDYSELDAVVLSHLHFDHCSDMFVLRYALDAAVRSGRLPTPMPVWCPAEPSDVASFMTYKEAMKASPIRPGVTVTIAGFSVEFLPMKHPIETYGVILRPAKTPAIGALFFYTGDTEFTEDLPESVGNCEILLAEATLSADQAALAGSVGHLTIGQAARLGGMINARTIILSHYPPGRREEEMVAEARRSLARPITVASEGLQVRWP